MMRDLTDHEIEALLPEADATGEIETPAEVRPGLWGYEVQVIDAWTKSLVIETVRAALALAKAQP